MGVKTTLPNRNAAGAKVSEADARAQARPVPYVNEPSVSVVGKTVYLRSTKTRIDTIEAVDAHHAFPRSFPHRRMSAALIHSRLHRPGTEHNRECKSGEPHKELQDRRAA